MKTLLLLAAVAQLFSPDGKLKVDIHSAGDAGTRYSVCYDGQTFLKDSRLGLVTDKCDYSRLYFTGSESRKEELDYSLDRIKTSRVRKQAVRAVTHFRTPEGRPLDVEWHISDNDVAFRYLIPKDTETGSVRVMREETSFSFPEGTTTYLCPQSDAMIGWKRSKPSYEEKYTLGAQMDVRSQYGQGYTFPCLFRVGENSWALVSETGVDSRYCASHLSDCDPADGYRIAFPMPEENNGNGTVEPAFALPGATPWRTITVDNSLAAIAETTAAFDVAVPRYESSNKYSFGKSTWSWIVWQDDSINREDLRKYIDLAAAMGFPYSLIDAGWDVNIGRKGMEELAEYARSRDVELFLWYSSSGWWNDIVQSPVNIMSESIARKAEMRWLRSIGVRGIKVDFFGGDKQETMRLYEDILSDADDHGLMVIFHGCTIPRGWERMYPNYVGSEAVLASENMVFGQEHCDLEAVNACLHPFIRNTVGCMEFGGTFLNRYLHRSNGAPDASGRIRGSLRRSTDAMELALAVLYQNPIQNFALAPNNLEDAPSVALDFLREVPTTWDETRFIDGFPGRYVVLARRSGSKWYVAAINADEKPLELDVKGIAARFGGRAQILCTQGGTPVRRGIGKRPLSIPRNDGAVIEIAAD